MLILQLAPKELLYHLREAPVSREFITCIKQFLDRYLDDTILENQKTNFLKLLLKYLFYSEEFGDKIITVRRDVELHLIKKTVQKTALIGNNNIIYQIQDNQKKNASKAQRKAMNVIKAYAESYTQNMFLQERNEAYISLKDVYIENKYEELISNRYMKVNGSLFEVIKDYCLQEESKSILFIEGHAGIGKTSIFSKMAYEYLKKKSEAKLVIVRLRDLLPQNTKVDMQNPWKDIKQYLCFKGSIKDFMKYLDKSIIILDGFDELCMIENIQLQNKFAYFGKLFTWMIEYGYNYKIIVSTRPNYLATTHEYKRIQCPKTVISLRHFSSLQREKWIEKAKKAGMNISSDVEEGIVSNCMLEDAEAIASTPFTLYLIVHEGIVLKNDSELWSVYHKIFGTEIIRKRYDRINKEEIQFHSAEVMATWIYELTKEIAFYMFVNSKFDILTNEIDKIILGLPDIGEDWYYFSCEYNNQTIDVKRLIKNNYALFSYYKELSNTGGVAFYHNYIQEFFIQEKIFAFIKALFTKDVGYLKNRDYNLLSRELEKILGIALLTDKTVAFFRSHIKSYYMGNAKDEHWISEEVRNRHLINLLVYLLSQEGQNIILQRNLFLILLPIYRRNHSRREHLNIFTQNEIIKINQNHHNFTKLFESIAQDKCLFYLNFTDLILRGANLKNAFIENCKFNNIDFSGARFCEVIFDHVNFERVKFNGCYFDHCAFCESQIDKCELMGCDIHNTQFLTTKLKQSQLNGVKGYKIEFDETNTVENIELDGAVFKNTDLRMFMDCY